MSKALLEINAPITQGLPIVLDLLKVPDARLRASDHNLPEVKEYLYKILVIGDLGTGKTSIIKRYVNNVFSMHYKSTIGVDFALKVLQWSPDTVVRLQLWDIAGQERFGNMTKVYYKEALGALVVYDVTRPSTFDGVTKWKNDLDQKVSLPEAWGGGSIPVVLMGNKCDLLKDGYSNKSESEMIKYCEENGFVKWFDTSAKENHNVDEAARYLVSQILEIEQRNQGKPRENRNGGVINIHEEQQYTHNSCC
ncbi:7094_t:CDS:2 [Ambispora gerdemannii]|uniref:Ras-related protein Rab n=1 Tax=Ambispora gerdemannii TaxID=144530 RepID=A0A9N8VIL2_9GLOM|nr:7094_t:CDS:2 [Ambispora gerdemannii]